ncbi:MAG: photosystem II stability/assembly factor-like uncharacterized protein [Hyphomicrobiaceae bacterium]|jgi:photosystem II stability/assembly factor-like uncharacterized protein
MRFSERPATRRFVLPLTCLAIAVLAGCHGETHYDPLATQIVYVSDRFYDTALLGPKHAIITGYNGKVLETTDSGVSWSQTDVGTDQALYSIDFATDSIGWIVGQESTILRTTDAGKTWDSQGGDVYMTTECREDPEDDRCALAPLFAITAIDANNAIAIGDRSTIIKTTDGGETWDISTLKPEGLELLDLNSLLAFEDPVLYDVEFFTTEIGFVVGEFGKIYKTIDSGATWIEKQASLVGDDYFDVLDLPTFFDIEFFNDKIGYVAGLDGRVARTEDSGETWTWMPHGVKDYKAPFYSAETKPDGSVWVVGASGQVVFSADGKSFGQGTFGTSVNNWVRMVEFYDNDNGWVVGGFGFIMNTSDGGKTWFRRIG